MEKQSINNSEVRFQDMEVLRDNTLQAEIPNCPLYYVSKVVSKKTLDKIEEQNLDVDFTLLSVQKQTGDIKFYLHIYDNESVQCINKKLDGIQNDEYIELLLNEKEYLHLESLVKEEMIRKYGIDSTVESIISKSSYNKQMEDLEIER